MMKKIGIIILLAAIIIQGFSQELSAVDQGDNRRAATNEKDVSTKINIGNDFLIVEEADSAINIRVKDRGISILESLEGRKYNFERYNDDYLFDEDDNERNRGSRRNRFKGHWSGVELGFNNYLTSDKSFVLPDEIDYMSIHSGKSMNFNINFSQLSIGLTRYIGFVTGLGLNWNNYKFDGNNNILKGDNGIIEVLDPGAPLKKSKLTTLYLDLPFMLEVQLPVNNNQLNLAAGPIGAIKIGSHTKMIYQDTGQKVKSNGDFSLNILRYGATARAGYENFQIYGTYYMNPMFSKGKSPGAYNLYPFEIGISFTFND